MCLNNLCSLEEPFGIDDSSLVFRRKHLLQSSSFQDINHKGVYSLGNWKRHSVKFLSLQGKYCEGMTVHQWLLEIL